MIQVPKSRLDVYDDHVVANTLTDGEGVYFCVAWKAIHASLSVPNTPLASIRCSTVEFDEFNCAKNEIMPQRSGILQQNVKE